MVTIKFHRRAFAINYTGQFANRESSCVLCYRWSCYTLSLLRRTIFTSRSLLLVSILGKTAPKRRYKVALGHMKDHVKMISKVLNTTGGSVVLFVARGNIFQINSIRKHSDKFPLWILPPRKKGNMLNKLAIRDFVNRDFLKPKNSPAYQKRKNGV